MVEDSHSQTQQKNSSTTEYDDEYMEGRLLAAEVFATRMLSLEETMCTRTIRYLVMVQQQHAGLLGVGGVDLSGEFEGVE
jgi:hypothetical protein